MKLVKFMIVVLLQINAAWVLGFVGALLLGIGNGWELPYFAISFALAVWSVGTLADRMTGVLDRQKLRVRFVGALIGAGLGAATLALPAVAFGFGGALLGYYGAGWIKR